jgi:hypothetical protein
MMLVLPPHLLQRDLEAIAATQVLQQDAVVGYAAHEICRKFVGEPAAPIAAEPCTKEKDVVHGRLSLCDFPLIVDAHHLAGLKLFDRVAPFGFGTSPV